MAITINKNNFNEIIKGYKKIIVYMWAPWCGPCRMLGQVLAELDEADQIVLGKINCDEEPELCQAFNVTNIPLLLLFEDGKITKKSVGYISKEEVLELYK